MTFYKVCQSCSPARESHSEDALPISGLGFTLYTGVQAPKGMSVLEGFIVSTSCGYGKGQGQPQGVPDSLRTYLEIQGILGVLFFQCDYIRRQNQDYSKGLGRIFSSRVMTMTVSVRESSGQRSLSLTGTQGNTIE